MEPDSWPFVCPACRVTIPNENSWGAHENGKKHKIKANELKRRTEEQSRTVHVSGHIASTPVAELLLRNYFEENYGAVEKIITQPKYCFVIFERAEVAVDCAKEKKHDLGGGEIVFVKERKCEEKQRQSATNQLASQMNKCATFVDQLSLVENAYRGAGEQLKNALDALFAELTRFLGDSFRLEYETVGSVRYDLLMAKSDVDICLSATQLKPLAADLKSLGEKTVRNPGRPSRTAREITDVLYVISGALVRLSDAQGVQGIHAVPGARKPVIRFLLKGQRVEVGLNNVAAQVNSRYIALLVADPIFLHLLKFTRFTLGALDVVRPGRFSSYSVTIALAAFLASKGILPSIASTVQDVAAVDVSDPFCHKKWDFRIPDSSRVKFAWAEMSSKQSAIATIVALFTQFCAWLSGVEGAVVDVRTGETMEKVAFHERYGLSDEFFKPAPIAIADPFEVEHNTTGQITPRSAHQINKILKSVQIKAKIKRFIDHVTNIDAVATGEKDWGLSVFLPQSSNLSPEKRDPKEANVVQVRPERIGQFFAFLRDVLRVEFDEFPMIESGDEGSDESDAKKMKMDEGGEANSFGESVPNLLHCSVGVKLWEGRRAVRRKLARAYANSSPIALESQVSNLLLSGADGSTRLSAALPFTIAHQDNSSKFKFSQVQEAASQSNLFAEFLRFVAQAVEKHFS